MTPTPQPLKDTDNASKRTIQARSQFLKTQIETISGSASTSQIGHLLITFSVEERLEILKKGNICSAILDAEIVVAMKSDLCLPWEKIKIMARLDKNLYIICETLRKKIFE